MYILVNAQKILYSLWQKHILRHCANTTRRIGQFLYSSFFLRHVRSGKRVSDGIHSSITASFSFGYKTNMADSEGRKWIRGNRLSTFSLLCQPYEFKYFLQICYLLLNYNDVKRCRHHARRRGLGSRKP